MAAVVLPRGVAGPSSGLLLVHLYSYSPHLFNSSLNFLFFSLSIQPSLNHSSTYLNGCKKYKNIDKTSSLKDFYIAHFV